MTILLCFNFVSRQCDQNRTDLKILPNGMNLCDIDISSHAATMQIIVNQYFVAFDSGVTILKEFKVSC